MESAKSISCIIKELEEFFAAADHLRLDDSQIESNFTRMLMEDHLMDDGELEATGNIKNEMFKYEMFHRGLDE